MSRVCFDDRQIKEWALATYPLPEVLSDWLVECEKISGPSQWLVSSFYRSPNEERQLRLHLASMRNISPTSSEVDTLTSGIHSTYRAIDIYCVPWDQAKVDLIAHAVNERWTYDPARPSKKVIYGAPHGTSPHVHIQVYPTTVRNRFRFDPDRREV